MIENECNVESKFQVRREYKVCRKVEYVVDFEIEMKYRT